MSAIQSPFRPEQEEEIEKLMTAIEELVNANLTDIDKGKPATGRVTKENMIERSAFTKEFLELINEIIIEVASINIYVFFIFIP